MIKQLISSFFVLMMMSPLAASEITHAFKNPSFSGVGTGSHYLTIENQEHSRKESIEDALEGCTEGGRTSSRQYNVGKVHT